MKKIPTWLYCTCNNNSIRKLLIGDFRVSRCVKNVRKWVERIIYHVQQLLGWFENLTFTQTMFWPSRTYWYPLSNKVLLCALLHHQKASGLWNRQLASTSSLIIIQSGLFSMTIFHWNLANQGFTFGFWTIKIQFSWIHQKPQPLFFCFLSLSNLKVD